MFSSVEPANLPPAILRALPLSRRLPHKGEGCAKSLIKSVPLEGGRPALRTRRQARSNSAIAHSTQVGVKDMAL